jgi:hypothetical protein
MSSRRAVATAVLVAATAVLLGCDGGESVGDVLERNEDTGDEESASGTSTTSGTSVAAEDVVVRVPPSGHRFDLGAPLATLGEVEDPDHYRQTTTIDSLVSEVIVVDALAFIREGTADTIATERYDQRPRSELTAEGTLEELDGIADAGQQVFADEVVSAAFQASVELAAVDVAAFYETMFAGDVEAEQDGDDVVLRTDAFVPAPAEELYAEVDDVEPIGAELRVDADGTPVSATVSVDLGDAVEIEVAYDFDGVEPVVAPSADQLDPTPDIDEEELAAFADTPLVAPAAPPVGTQLRSVLVLPAERTLEGCPQVQLVYADGADVDNLVVFLLPQTCALAYDDTPYDQTYGGLPSRFDGYEVLFGTTVVQLDGTLREPEFEVVAESLQPTTAEALVAAVVPMPD